MSRKNIGQENRPTQTNSNVVSIDEFRERKNFQGGILEYPCVDIISYELGDYDGEKFTTIRFDDDE